MANKASYPAGPSGLAPMHPGELLREVVLPDLKARKISRLGVAERLGVPRSSFYQVLDGKRPVDAPLALKLGRLFGNGAEFWLALQSRYDLRTAEAAMAGELAAIEPLPKAA